MAAAARRRLERPWAAFPFSNSLQSPSRSINSLQESPFHSLDPPHGEFLILGEPHGHWLHVNLNFIYFEGTFFTSVPIY